MGSKDKQASLLQKAGFLFVNRLGTNELQGQGGQRVGGGCSPTSRSGGRSRPLASPRLGFLPVAKNGTHVALASSCRTCHFWVVVGLGLALGDHGAWLVAAVMGGGGILGWEIWGTLVTKGFEVGSGCSKAPP